MRRELVHHVACVLAACSLAHAAHSKDLKTTYGEDPVPDTGCYHGSNNHGYIKLGYGIDPIPAETPTERWEAWRARRRAARAARDARIYYRTGSSRLPPISASPPAPQPTAQRFFDAQWPKPVNDARR